MKKLAKNREQRVEEIKQQLLRDSFPRLEISAILLFTLLTGFLTSFILLHAGFSSMALRYPVCIAAAYCVFLLLLRLWLWLQNPHSRTDGSFDNFDLGDLPIPSSNNSAQGSSSTNNGGGAFEFGGGGDFSGAGSGGSWGTGISSDAGGSSLLDGVGFDFDLEEIGLIILAVVAVIGGLLATFYVIWIAPILLAEILVDGVLITGLYNRVKKIEPRYWLETAVKKTLLPAILAALFFGLAGFMMQSISPKAHSVGEFFYQLNNKSRS